MFCLPSQKIEKERFALMMKVIRQSQSAHENVCVCENSKEAHTHTLPLNGKRGEKYSSDTLLSSPSSTGNTTRRYSSASYPSEAAHVIESEGGENNEINCLFFYSSQLLE